jgi:hypothetical protein
MLLERDDGSTYALHVFHQEHTYGGQVVRLSTQGGVEHPDGTREPFVAVAADLAFEPENRRLRGGTLHATMADGTARPITLTTVGDTGFHLGAGLYFGFDGQWHGQHRGPLHVDGEHVADCTTRSAAERLHQLRDTIVTVEDPVGGGRGWANAQPLVLGGHPELGLDEAGSFM